MPYSVTGGIGGPGLPGVLGPQELDPRSEWVPLSRRRDLIEELAARLGSEVDLHKVVLAVLCPLRQALDGPPLDALIARLPIALAGELAGASTSACPPVRPPTGVGEYLLDVSRLIMHPPPRAASYVRAVFAAARASLAPEDLEAIAARLPPDIAELWRKAR